MEISKYINIPKSISTTSSYHKYLSYMEILISLLTGILLICFTQINQYVATSSQIQIIYLFSVILTSKFVIVLNYIFKRKIPKNRLQQAAKVHVRGIFIPGFIKSLLYFGLMMLCLYLGQVLIVLPIIASIIGIQLTQYWMTKRNKNNQEERTSTRSFRKRRRSTSCLNLQQILMQILLIIAIFLHVQQIDTVSSIPSVIAICFCGTLCLLAYYYLHSQIFLLYQSEVDEILAKQYPIQLFNFVFVCLMFYYSSLGETQNSNSLQQTKQQNQQIIITSSKFIFILQFPIHTFVSIFFSILYQYLCFQMMKKVSFKYLFLTQMTGIFWFNLYYLKSGIQTSLYFSTFLSFLALVLLTRLISVEKIGSRIILFINWIRKKKFKTMVQEEN